MSAIKDGSPRQKESQIIAEIVTSEKTYLDGLGVLDALIKNVYKREAEWMEQVLQVAPVAIIFNFIEQLYIITQSLYAELTNSSTLSVDRLCLIFDNFTFLFTLYGKFAEIYQTSLKSLHDLQANMAEFDDYLAKNQVGNQTIEALLILPIQRLPRYELFFKELLKLGCQVDKTLANIKRSIEYVNDSVLKYENYICLCEIQKQFISNQIDLISDSKYYDRKLLKAEELNCYEQMHDAIEISPTKLQLHLFNDILIVSENKNNSTVNHRFKCKHIIDFKLMQGIKVETVSDGNYGVQISWNETSLNVYTITEAEAQDWLKVLSHNVQFTPVVSVDKRYTALDATFYSKTLTSVLAILNSEVQFLNNLEILIDVMVQPVLDGAMNEHNMQMMGSIATTNAILRLTSSPPQQSTVRVVNATPNHRNSRKTSAFSYLKNYASTNSFNSTNISDLLTAEDLIDTRDESIGAVFALFAPVLRLYAGYQARYRHIEQFLSQPAMADLCRMWQRDPRCSHLESPTTLFELPLHRLQTYSQQLSELLQHNPSQEVHQALSELEAVGRQNSRLAEERANNDILVGIRRSLYGKLPATLVAEHRVLLLQDDLVKVCRGKLQRYHFYLFNDAMLYAKAKRLPFHLNGDGRVRFHFHALLNLSTCSVIENVQQYERYLETLPDCKKPHKPLPHLQYNSLAFVVQSTAKSFVLIAKSKHAKEQWVKLLADRISFLKANVPATKLSFAPVLFPYDQVSSCSICKIPFSKIPFKRRKLHCKKCGDVVCKQCSKTRQQLLKHQTIQKFRVCNQCA